MFIQISYICAYICINLISLTTEFISLRVAIMNLPCNMDDFYCGLINSQWAAYLPLLFLSSSIFAKQDQVL